MNCKKHRLEIAKYSLGVPKISQNLIFFFIIWQENVPCSYHGHKQSKRGPELVFYYFLLVLLLQLFKCFILKYISFSTNPASNCFNYIWFPVQLWLITYGSLRWANAVCQSEWVHLGEPLQTPESKFYLQRSLSF